MNCKFCGAELDETLSVCPECGKPQQDDANLAQQQAAEAAEAAAAEQAAAEETEAEESEAEGGETNLAPECSDADAEAEAETEAEGDAHPEKHEKRKMTVLITAVAVLGALVLALLALLLVPKLSGQNEQTQAQTQQQAPIDAPSYYCQQEELTDAVLDTVVASCGEDQLKNRQFPFYYWEQYRIFLNSYGQYISYILDTTQGLDKQMYDDQQTWQQLFMRSGATMYHSVSACTQEAEKNGFVLSDQTQQSIANMAEGLEQTAKSYGYEGAQDFLTVNFGSGCTVDDYVEFVRKMRVAREYLNYLVDQKGVSDEEITKYFDEHAEQYLQSGIEKIDKPNVTVRHILIMPEEKDEEGNYTDAAWKAAEEKINEILAEFESGARSEKRFSELAELYSQDGGSASNGGLYADVFPGQMVESFNDWCFADERKEGDCGIVKTEYGYHLIFFVSQSEEIYWYETAKEDLRNELSTQIEEELAAKYETTFDESKVRLVDVMAQSAASSEPAE